MALTATSMPTPPSHLLYTNTNDNYRRPSQLKTSNLTSDLDLAVFVADLMTSYAGTPPLSSASSSSESSMDSPPNTITVKNISREILFGTGIPSSPLAGLSTAGVRHKRTLSFSATLLHRPSVASNISYDGEGREEEFHASFPLPPRAEISDDLYSNGNIRRASVPASDTASLMAQLDETSRYLDEVLPCTPSPTGRYPPSPTDPSPRERFSCRYGYPETYYSLALPSSNPSPDDAHPKLTNRDTVLSLPFVWADGSPLKRQPTNASIHPLRTNLKRQKSQYAPFPESPKLFSPTWAEGGFGFPFWELNSGSPVNPTRSTRRPSLKNLTISTKIEPPLPTKINTILETDPKTNEQPSPVPSSACLPDSLWPSPVLEPIQLPIETLTPLDLDDVFLVAHTKPLQAEKEIDIDQAMKDRETVLRVSERLNQEQLLSPARPSPPRTPVARPQVLAPVSACQKHPAPLMTTLPLRINKDLPQRPQTPANVSLVQEMVHPVPVKTVKHGKRSTDDLWRTMVPPLNSPLQVKADKVKQASQRGSPESSPIPIPANPRRTPSPVKHSNSPPRVGCLSPTQVSPAPSIRSASPAKTPVPPRPMRSPSPLILNGLDFLDDYHSPLRHG
ncbi:hypothetical protein DACRYDRAFT_15263 [Dacryopinax primogenitus]|uniref:Uncharacterized protein n=1 Tax=Dacryopinax primogenitus (strain DJM 731) TaxID=1858805 RepID=M5GDN9_DACPD|nr:uncharacterized protein DACRYDRAFT_15263 [Dacryopinax primogenitus]EJU02578.1 hypothetical protein DACRYDRAFT_15263 [Dacryopinax primogenitus]